MSNDQSQQPASSGLHISLDWWAVIVAFVLVVIVLVGVSVPWNLF